MLREGFCPDIPVERNGWLLRPLTFSQGVVVRLMEPGRPVVADVGARQDMTFYEAAIEVLKGAGRPLHFKKITELAIERGLLSDVGKTSGLSMGAQLTQEIRSRDGGSAVLQTRPGVFGLREWQAVEAAAPASEAVKAPDPEPEALVEPPESPAPGRRRRRARRRRAAQPARVVPETSEAPVEAVEAPPEAPRSAPRSPVDSATVPAAFSGVALRAFGVLKGHERRPMKAAALAEVVVDEATASTHTLSPEALINSALTSDNVARQRVGLRPQFAAYAESAWGLVEWGLSDKAQAQESELTRLARVLRSHAEERLAAALLKVSREGLEHLVWKLLEHIGYRDLKAARRLDDGSLVISAASTRLSDVRDAIHVRHCDAELSLEDVVTLRGTLHHHDAHTGIIIALGGVSDEGLEESRTSNLPPVSILDAARLASLLVRHGVGVRTHPLPVVVADVAFLRDLGER